jgi:lysozyme family protein
MSDLFKKTLKFVLKKEGGYVNDPDDKGGATNKGITQFTYDQYRKDCKLALNPVKNITDKEVEEIYYKRYWLANKCDTMNPVFAVMVFDTAVNMGSKVLAGFLISAGYKFPEKFMLARIRKYKEYAMVGNQRKFLLGWLNRCFDLLDFIKNEVK